MRLFLLWILFLMFVQELVYLALSHGSRSNLWVLIKFCSLVCDFKEFPSCALASLHGEGRSRGANTLRGVPRSAERKTSLKISPFLSAGWPLKLFFCGFGNVRETYRRLRIDRSRQNSFSFHLAAASCEGNKALWALLGVIAVASCGIRLILRLRSLRLLLRGAATAPSSTLVFPALSSGWIQSQVREQKVNRSTRHTHISFYKSAF